MPARVAATLRNSLPLRGGKGLAKGGSGKRCPPQGGRVWPKVGKCGQEEGRGQVFGQLCGRHVWMAPAERAVFIIVAVPVVDLLVTAAAVFVAAAASVPAATAAVPAYRVVS